MVSKARIEAAANALADEYGDWIAGTGSADAWMLGAKNTVEAADSALDWDKLEGACQIVFDPDKAAARLMVTMIRAWFDGDETQAPTIGAQDDG